MIIVYPQFLVTEIIFCEVHNFFLYVFIISTELILEIRKIRKEYEVTTKLSISFFDYTNLDFLRTLNQK